MSTIDYTGDKERGEPLQPADNNIDDQHGIPTQKETAKVKGIRVGKLTDGWKPFDPTAKKSSFYIKEILLGITISFSQLTECIAFGLLAHVNAAVALHATYIIGIICAIFGGRPGMINGASGAFAVMVHSLVSTPLDEEKNGAGIEYLFPSVIAAGVFMILFSALKLNDFLLNIMSSAIVIGFCDALAIVIAYRQVPHYRQTGSELMWMIIMAVVCFSIIEFGPKLKKRFRLFKVLPAALFAIMVAIFMEYAIIRPLGHSRTNTIEDVAKLDKEDSLPKVFYHDVDFDMSTLKLRSARWWWRILHQGFMLAIIGMVESLLTMKVVDGYTGTVGDGTRQGYATGLGNIVAGLFGGMGGTAMIGLSTISGINGGQGRIAPLTAALSIMAMLMAAHNLLNYIPITVLSVIMLKKVLLTFRWYTVNMILFAFIPSKWLTRLGFPARKVNRADVLIIVAVIVMTILFNLFYAVVSGIGLSIVVFIVQVKANGGTWKYVWRAFTQPIFVSKKSSDLVDSVVYIVRGPLFFGSVRTFITLFNPKQDPTNVAIYMEDGKIYDYSSLEALNRVCKDFKTAGKSINVMNLSEKSKRAIQKVDVPVLAWFTKLFSFTWLLGDIEIASDDQAVGEDVIEVQDILATEAAFGVEETIFTIDADPDNYSFT